MGGGTTMGFAAYGYRGIIGLKVAVVAGGFCVGFCLGAVLVFLVFVLATGS